jgi:hypothetical protein
MGPARKILFRQDFVAKCKPVKPAGHFANRLSGMSLIREIAVKVKYCMRFILST